MGIIWAAMVAISVVCGLATGRIDAVAAGALDGAAQAVELCLSMTGVLCLWMGVMEIMRRSGLSEKLARLLRPVLKRLYPDFARDRAVMDTVAANVSANLLGLGNAATPLGMEGFPPFADLSFLDSLPAGAAVFDLIYAPRKTELYQAARARGLIAITGMELLVQQAILAFNHFTGAGLEQEATRRELLALVNET